LLRFHELLGMNRPIVPWVNGRPTRMNGHDTHNADRGFKSLGELDACRQCTPRGPPRSRGCVVMADAHSGAFSSASLPLTSFESGLLLNCAISKWLGLQAFVGDACAAFDRSAEGAPLDPRFGAGHGRKLAL